MDMVPNGPFMGRVGYMASLHRQGQFLPVPQMRKVWMDAMNQHVGQDNGRLLALIDSGKMTRKQLNEERRAGLWREIHRGLIEDAFACRGL